MSTVYIYTIVKKSDKRGYNRTINVWSVNDNIPVFLGYTDEVNTSGYKGDYATACELIAEFDKHAMSNCGYFLQNKDIKVIELS
jgi:hypothetical protein